MQTLPLTVPGNLGNIEGADADGVLVGQGTMDDPAKALLKFKSAAGLCITDDGGSYVNETTPFGESTGDDVEIITEDGTTEFADANIVLGLGS